MSPCSRASSPHCTRERLFPSKAKQNCPSEASRARLGQGLAKSRMAGTSGADTGATFALEDEGHTLANALRFMLNQK